MSSVISRYFKLEERGTNFATEIRGGVTTFLTMAYILLVNPQILKAAGLRPSDTGTSTALLCGVGTIVLGLVTNLPFAIGPGMGLNTYFAGLVGNTLSLYQVLTTEFIAGLFYVVLALCNGASFLMKIFPLPIKTAIMVGIGLYQAFVGIREIHLVVPSTACLVDVGSIYSSDILLSMFGLFLISWFFMKGVKGSILIGIAVATVLAWICGISPIPQKVISLPHVHPFIQELNFREFLEGWRRTFPNVIGFILISMFDVGGVLFGVGSLMVTGTMSEEAEPILDKNGDKIEECETPTAANIASKLEIIMPHNVTRNAFLTIGGFTSLAALLGCSPVIIFLECSAGVKEGARTGLASVVSGVLFLIALWFIPLFSSIPVLATAPAMVLIGSLMMSGAGSIDWFQLDVALPCFLTISMMPFTSDISVGIVFGVAFYLLMRIEQPFYSLKNRLTHTSPPLTESNLRATNIHMGPIDVFAVIPEPHTPRSRASSIVSRSNRFV